MNNEAVEIIEALQAKAAGNFSIPQEPEVVEWIDDIPVDWHGWYAFIVEGMGFCTVSGVGVLCNLMAIYVVVVSFSETEDLPDRVREKNKDIKGILIALALSDLLFLITGVAIFGLPSASTWYHIHAYPYVLPKLYGVAHMAHVASVLLTLVVTLERFYSVCYPLQTPKYRQYYVLTVLIFTLLYNIPRFFEVGVSIPPPSPPLTTTTDLDDGILQDNRTASDEYIPQLIPTDLRNNWYYVQFYMFWSRLILIEVIPYSLMITMNYFIWKRIKTLVVCSRQKRSKRTTATTSADGSSLRSPPMIKDEFNSSEEDLSEEEIQLARTLLIVVFVFIFCQSFKIIPDLYEVIWCSQYYIEDGPCRTTPFIENVIDTSHFMLAINSSVNFFIYVWHRGKFRQTIINLVRPGSPVVTSQRGAYEMVPLHSRPTNEQRKPLVHLATVYSENLQKTAAIIEVQSCPTNWPMTMYDIKTVRVEKV